MVAYNTILATQWLAVACEVGLLPVQDYGLACCDSTFETSLSFSTLARVLFDRFDMGTQAAEMMLQILQYPKTKCPSRRIPVQWYPGSTIART